MLDFRCGGSLINQWHVVTAGHCVARARPNQVPSRSLIRSPQPFNEWDMRRLCSQVRVTLGEYVLKSDVEPLPGRTYGATQIKVHPYFRFTPQVTAKMVTMKVRVNLLFLPRTYFWAPGIMCCLLEIFILGGPIRRGSDTSEPASRLRPSYLSHMSSTKGRFPFLRLSNIASKLSLLSFVLNFCD